MRLFVLPILACVLVACDAGNRADPGSDNKFPGPELTIVQPGPGQVVTIQGHEFDEKTVDGKKVTVKVPGLEMPRAFFDLRNLAPKSERVGDRIYFRIDGGTIYDVEDWSVPVPFREGEVVPSGTRLMVACVWSGKLNAPYPNPESVVVRRFHIGGETGRYDLWLTDGKEPRAPLLETGPLLFVMVPTSGVKESRLTFAFKGTDFGTKYRVAYRVDQGDWQHTMTVAPVPLPGLEAGKHTILVRLEQAHVAEGKTTWRLPPRPYFARNAASDEAVSGEFNVTEMTFTTE